VAAEVARSIGAPLDVLVVRKLGAPMQRELALGAVASGGMVTLNDEIVDQLGVSANAIAAIIAEERAIVDRRDLLYRGDRAPVEIGGRTVVVVDDGLATGATMRVALMALRPRAARLVAAAPVAPPETVEMLQGLADHVAVLATPEQFVAVGSWYRDFRQVSDDEVSALLR
jgi:putative phosphoribosyl transferase